MHVTTETTIADTASRTPDNREFAEKLEEARAAAGDFGRSMRKVRDVIAPRTVPVVRSKRRRAGKSPIVAIARPRRARQVLVPGKRKAARHPWADRIEAARTGGFTVGQIFTNTSRVTACCFACGARFTLDARAATRKERDAFEDECRQHQPSPLDGVRPCLRVVA